MKRKIVRCEGLFSYIETDEFKEVGDYVSDVENKYKIIEIIETIEKPTLDLI